MTNFLLLAILLSLGGAALLQDLLAAAAILALCLIGGAIGLVMLSPFLSPFIIGAYDDPHGALRFIAIFALSLGILWWMLRRWPVT
jgi:hypothetical protein